VQGSFAALHRRKKKILGGHSPSKPPIKTPRAATEKEIWGGEAAPNPTKGYCQLNPSTGC